MWWLLMLESRHLALTCEHSDLLHINLILLLMQRVFCKWDVSPGASAKS